jgi:DNA-binding FadR family transcriptional regulator
MTSSEAGPATAARGAEQVRVPRPVGRAARTSEVVAASIRSQIARGELAAGDRFPPEDELMEVFGIARTSLREALRILEAEGLVTVVRGRNGGPRVTTPSVEHMTKVFALLLQIEGAALTDVYDALAVIEPPLAGQLAASHTPQALAELREAIEAAAVAAAVQDDGTAFGEAAATVHHTLLRNAGNTSLSIFGRLLHDVIEQLYRRSGQQVTAAERGRAVKSYRRFLGLVESGDAAGAQEHWNQLMHYPDRRNRQRVDLYS